MKTELISRKKIEEAQAANNCGVKAALEIIAPWACVFSRVFDADAKIGYMAFESSEDFKTWKNQK